MISKTRYNFFRIAVLILTVTVVILIPIPLLIYFFKFAIFLSPDHMVWASFGSYIGGTIGVLIAFLNFLILLYLTIKVHRIHDQQWLTSLRLPFYKEILGRTNLLSDPSTTSLKSLKKYLAWLKQSDFRLLLFIVDSKEERQLNWFKRMFSDSIEQIIKNSELSSNREDHLLDNLKVSKHNFLQYLGAIMMQQTSEFDFEGKL